MLATSVYYIANASERRTYAYMLSSNCKLVILLTHRFELLHMKSLESKPKLPFCPFVVVSFVSSTLLCLSLRLLLLRQVRSVAPIGSTGTIPERKPVPVAANVVAVVVVVPSRTVEQVAWVEIPAKVKKRKKKRKNKNTGERRQKRERRDR